MSVSSPRRPLVLTHTVAGHTQEVDHQAEVGDFNSKCMAEYGAAWMLKGPLGVSCRSCMAMSHAEF